MPRQPTAALDLLASLPLEDGRLWGDAAVRYQWDAARAFFDPDGPRFHWHGRPRGGSKTTDAAAFAAVALVAELPPGSRAYAAAADRDQSRLLLDALAGFVQRSSTLRGALKVDTWRITGTRTGSQLEALAADGPGTWGLKPALVIVDEVTGWPETRNATDVWDALTTSLGKRPGARALVISTAGDPTHWSRKAYQFAQSSPLWQVSDVHGPVPWTDAAFLAEEQRRLPESRYAQLYRNEWVASEDRLVDAADLAAAVMHDGALPREDGNRYVIGVDLGLKKDRTVAAVVHGEQLRRTVDDEDNEGAGDTVWAGDPRTWARPVIRTTGVRIVLDKMEVWTPMPGNPVRLENVEDWLREAWRIYDRPTIVFDPWNAQGMLERLEGIGARCEVFTFSQTSVGRLALTLYQLLRDRQISLPNDQELLDELAAVRLVQTTPGVFRMDHNPNRHDDRAIALALAAQHALPDASVSTEVGVLKGGIHGLSASGRQW